MNINDINSYKASKGNTYSISELSKILSIEPHVLRNWESELKLMISRNEFGHRSYCENDLAIFTSTKQLKTCGFSLKQIRLLVPYMDKLTELDDTSLALLKEQLEQHGICEDSRTFTQTTSCQPVNTTNLSISTSSNNNSPSTPNINDTLELFTKELGNSIAIIVAKELNYHLLARDQETNARITALEKSVAQMKHPILFHAGKR